MTQCIIGQTVCGIAPKRFIVTQIEQFAQADFVGRNVVSRDVKCRQGQFIFPVLRIDSLGFEQLPLVPRQVVPDERGITSQGVILRRSSAWLRHGIKCFARAISIAESNGTTRPGCDITLGVLAQFRHSSPKLNRSAQIRALRRSRDYSHGIRILGT